MHGVMPRIKRRRRRREFHQQLLRRIWATLDRQQMNACVCVLKKSPKPLYFTFWPSSFPDDGDRPFAFVVCHGQTFLDSFVMFQTGRLRIFLMGGFSILIHSCCFFQQREEEEEVIHDLYFCTYCIFLLLLPNKRITKLIF